MQRHQRAGASSIDRRTRSTEIEVVRDPVRDQRGSGAQKQLSRRIHRLICRLTVIFRATDDPDKNAGVTSCQLARVLPRILDSVPHRFEKDPLAWIHRGGFTWRDPKKGCIKFIDIIDETAHRDRTGPVIAQALLRTLVNRISPRTQVVPKRINIWRVRQAGRHTNDRDRSATRASRYRGIEAS